MAHLFDGKAISAAVRHDIRKEVAAWTAAGHAPPYLAVVLVGDDPASASYVRGKIRARREVGIAGDALRFKDSATEQQILKVVWQLGRRPEVDGILVQLPLPAHIDANRVISELNPDKDVDGLHVVNAGRLVTGREGLVPCTPAGVVELLRRSGIKTSGRRAVIVGRSNLVGKPLASLLMRKGYDATVTVCHSRTRNLADLCKQADILVAAIGRPRFITADMIKPGAAVIDVGINRIDDPSRPRGYRLVGDVDYDSVKEKAGWITPVPGGVGPMTIAMLLQNTLRATQRAKAGN